ncbi:MAG: hypothetical protein ACYS32_08285 [Planctomycetota bacterium]|jgi:hypothetical protein
MKTRKVETKVAVLVLAVVGLLAFSLFAAAGGLENNGPPSPMGRPFALVHDTITSNLLERQGYCRTFVVPADTNQVIFTVPDGKRFVLLRLYVAPDYWLWHPMFENWNLTVDDELFINNRINRIEINGDPAFPAGVSDNYKYVHDFPDRCAVVNDGETLTATNNGEEEFSSTIIGYFYDVQ